MLIVVKREYFTLVISHLFEINLYGWTTRVVWKIKFLCILCEGVKPTDLCFKQRPLCVTDRIPGRQLKDSTVILLIDPLNQHSIFTLFLFV